MTAAKAEWIKETLADPFYSDADVLAGFLASGIDAEQAARYVAIRAVYQPVIELEVVPTVGSSIRAFFAGLKEVA